MEGDRRGEALYGIPEVIRWSVWICGIPWISLPWDDEDEGVDWRPLRILEVPVVLLEVTVSFPLLVLEGFDLDLFGPLTRPSLAYSQIRPRVKQRLQVGCSPLHYEMKLWLTLKDRRLEWRTNLCLPRAALLACLCGAQSRVLRCTVEDAGWRVEWASKR